MKIIALPLGAAMLLAASSAEAAATFQQIAPVPTSYSFGPDFYTPLFGPTVYDVTASVFAVTDLTGTSLSLGCTASDYAGFASGSIALISRGTCSFVSKVAAAQAAGAVGVLIGNQAVNAGMPPPQPNGVDPSIVIPSFTTSFELRDALFAPALAGTLNVRMAASAAPGVPEPATWAMMMLGFGLIGAAARRKSRRVTAS